MRAKLQERAQFKEALVLEAHRAYLSFLAEIVEKYGDEPAQVLTFYKHDTDMILIGRKSSVSTKPQADETDRALFRCPVISRRHAKIIFTQYGNVRFTCSQHES